MSKVVAKRYYRIEFTFASALSIGSGENSNSDKDLLLNRNGDPYIPASSLAGIYRSKLTDEEAKRYLGFVPIETGSSESTDQPIIESELAVYDAELYKGTPVISIRDGIKVDKYKTAITGSKFDYEILEPGCTFITYVEHSKLADSENIFDKIVPYILSGEISIGGKTTRGLGSIKDSKVKYVEFSLENDELENWLNFDMYDDEYWLENGKDIKDETATENGISIKLTIKQNSFLSVREYRTDTDAERSLPDYQQMEYSSLEGYNPVIPGSSWNGLFRHYLEMNNCSNVEELFGDTGHKSKVTFSETLLKDAKTKIISRNSIDRFTGGTVDAALFTEKTCYGGSGSLEIKLPPYNEKYRNEYLKIFEAIADLHAGLLAIGGLTAVGHGLFEIEEIRINGKPIDCEMQPENIYNALIANITKEDGSYEQH